MTTIASGVYSAAADYGRAQAYMMGFFLILFGLIMLVVGIYLIFKKSKYDASVNGTVVEANCTPMGKTMQCQLQVSYSVLGKSMKASVSTYDTVHRVGDSMKLEYVSTDPQNVREYEGPTKTLGMILSGVGVICILIAIATIYFNAKYKTVAAVSGAQDFINLF